MTLSPHMRSTVRPKWRVGCARPCPHPRRDGDATRPGGMDRRKRPDRAAVGPVGDHRQHRGRRDRGVALLPLPPGGTDLEIGWQLSPNAWGYGYGAEAGHAVAHQAFENPGISEVFAVVRPENRRGVATARRVGMEWVGETDKYYNLTLQVYRLTKADLDLPEPACAH